MPANADTIQNALEAVAEGDVESLLATLDEEIEWRPPKQGTLAEAFNGHEGVQKMFEQLFESWETIGHLPEKLLEGDDQAILIAQVHLRARMSGMEIEERWGYFMEFREGLLWKVQMYTDPEEALREHSSAVVAAGQDFPENLGGHEEARDQLRAGGNARGSRHRLRKDGPLRRGGDQPAGGADQGIAGPDGVRPGREGCPKGPDCFKNAKVRKFNGVSYAFPSCPDLLDSAFELDVTVKVRNKRFSASGTSFQGDQVTMEGRFVKGGKKAVGSFTVVREGICTTNTLTWTAEPD